MGVQELHEYRSSDNSLGDGMQETGVQTIAWEAEGWRLWGVQEILKEYRRIFRSSGEIL